MHRLYNQVFLLPQVTKHMVNFQFTGEAETKQVNPELRNKQMQFAELLRACPPRLSLLVHCDTAIARDSLSTTLTILGTKPLIKSNLFFALPSPSLGKAFISSLEKKP